MCMEDISLVGVFIVIHVGKVKYRSNVYGHVLCTLIMM